MEVTYIDKHSKLLITAVKSFILRASRQALPFPVLITDGCILIFWRLPIPGKGRGARRRERRGTGR